MAPPALVGSATQSFGLSATVTADAPSGVQAGDHQLVWVVLCTTGEELSGTPSGWVLLATDTFSSTSGPADTTRAYLFASDPGADPVGAQFSQGKISGTRRWSSVRLAYRGGTGPIGAAFGKNQTLGTTQPVPQQSVAVADSVVVGGVVCDQSGTGNTVTITFTPPAGWGELVDAAQGAGAADALSVSVADLDVAAPGNINGSFTSSLSEDSFTWSVTFVGDAAGGDGLARTRGFLPILLAG